MPKPRHSFYGKPGMNSSPGLVLAPHIGESAPMQPCSGVKIVDVRVYGPGVASVMPEFVCVIKPAA